MIMIEFQKFCQSLCKQIYHEETKVINGTFRELPTGKIIKGDNFVAHLVGRGSAEETYKTYLKWFNHTRTDLELEREFVSAKFEDELKSRCKE